MALRMHGLARRHPFLRRLYGVSLDDPCLSTAWPTTAGCWGIWHPSGGG